MCSYCPFLPPNSSFARLAIISLAFMLYGVPAPAWSASRVKSLSNFPLINSWQAFSMAFAFLGLINFSWALVFMAASFVIPRAFLNISGAVSPLIWKFSFARAVCELK